MSIELLDKTRRINRLLNEQHSSKMAFDDFCLVLGRLLSASVYVISSKGKVLGTYCTELESVIPLLRVEKGRYIDVKLNERFMNVLSTKENVNLMMLGISEEEAADYRMIITPISIGGRHLGTLTYCRQNKEFGIEDIILSEYGTTVVGLEMMWSVQEESDTEEREKKVFSSAIMTMTSLERKAIACVIHELDGRNGTLVTSKLAKEIGITRTVIVNALRKMESAGLMKTKSSGVKGTYIQVLNDIVCRELEDYDRENGFF